MEFILSNEDINSKGMVIKTDGIDLNNFISNPVMLYNHDADKVIGKWSNIRKVDNKLIATPDFDEDDDEAMKIKKKVEKNLIAGASVGLIIKNYINKEEYLEITESELYEVSITAIPANVGAKKIFYMGEELDINNIQLSLENINIKNNIKQMDEIKINELENTIVELNKSVEGFQTILNDNQVLLSNKENEIVELKNKIVELETEKRNKEINDFIDSSIQDKLINEEQKESFLKLALVDFNSVKKIIEGLKPVSVERISQKIETSVVKNNLTSGREGWNFGDWVKNDPTALLNMKEEEPETYWKLYNDLTKNGPKVAL